MKIKPLPRSFVQTVLVTIIMAGLAYIGFGLPQESVEEVVDNYLPEEPKAERTPQSLAGNVQQVIDGDTVIVSAGGKEITVRLIGIDTPEIAGSPAGAECYGSEASEFAKNLLLNQTVILTTDPTQDTYDKHDRLLAYISFNDGRDAGEIMTREGFAREFTYDQPYKNQSAYRTAEAAAKAEQKGLWSACNEA